MKKTKSKEAGTNVVKAVLIVVLIIFLMFIVHTIKNYIIITGLQNKISQYTTSTNYYTKSIAKEDNGTIVIMEYYKKDNKQAVFLRREKDGNFSKVSMYNNGTRTDTFTETENSKTVQLNSGTIINVNIYNYLEADSKWQTFLGSMITSVKSIKCNEKDCYVISNFASSSSLSENKQIVYIEKDTGLFSKVVTNQMETQREYKFNNVDDSVFTEPDVSQYTLKESK